MIEKKFVVRKYIMAKSAMDAIKKDKVSPVDDVWIDEEWKTESLKKGIGFDEKKAN